MILLLGACTGQAEKDKTQEKSGLDEILKMHDKVMGESESAMKNKILIDSLLKQKKLPDAQGTATAAAKELDNADNAMENWMHNFNADYAGKSHEDIVKYLQAQKKQLLSVDSQLNAAIKHSDSYLQAYKKPKE